MLQYVGRRLLLAIPVIIGILVVTFLLARLIPGDPCKAILGEKATAEACEAFAANKGLDEPVITQLGIYMGDMATGDFGSSIRFKRPVAQIMVERFPMTIELSIAALAIALVVGVSLGVLSAMRHNWGMGVGTMVFANIGVSMPVFWLGLLLAYLFGYVLRDTFLALPPSGRLSAGLVSIPFYEAWGWDFQEGQLAYRAVEFISNHFIFNSLITADWEILGDAIRHLLLPAVALSTIPMAIIARMTRSSLLDVLGSQYIRTARAKGAPERRVVVRHALRNALLPVTTIVGLQMGMLLSGAILTETVFGLAGAGTMLFEAITARDFPIIQGFTVVIASSYVLLNLAIDVAYAYIDPRIRLE